MTDQSIPTGIDPFYQQTTTLDGIPFLLSFAFNQRCLCWYLSIATLEGVPIQSGIKLVCNWDLTGKCASPLKPAGKLAIISNTTDASTPGLYDLASGGRCVLKYFPAADVLAFIQARTP